MHNLNAALNWNLEADTAFVTLKQDLSCASALAVPDYTLPFHLDVSERGSQYALNTLLH